ncbi:hypothetical protein VKT23_013896 [Stygiomarasmius scandens]|uniref:Uncharacterized protein n=1 Tax=Marasmiellus scandens TaxID=2682957 RepID=A0ABR1J3E2_9AGAR
MPFDSTPAISLPNGDSPDEETRSKSPTGSVVDKREPKSVATKSEEGVENAEAGGMDVDVGIDEAAEDGRSNGHGESVKEKLENGEHNADTPLTPEQLDHAKDIVLDLLGWGVEPEYLIQIGVSSHAIYRIFTDLNLRLPRNLSL